MQSEITSFRSYPYFDAVQIVNRQHGGALISKADETEALLLARDLVAYQINVNDLAVLWEDANNVAFAQIVW